MNCPIVDWSYTETFCGFDIFMSIIIIDDIIWWNSEFINDWLVVFWIGFFHTHLCRAKYPIEKSFKIHILSEIVESIFFLIGRDIAFYSIFSQFLDFLYEFVVWLIFEVKPIFQILLCTSFPSPIWEKWCDHFSEIRFSENAFLKYSSKKGLHDFQIDSSFMRVFLAPHRRVDKDSVGIKEDTFHMWLHAEYETSSKERDETTSTWYSNFGTHDIFWVIAPEYRTEVCGHRECEPYHKSY